MTRLPTMTPRRLIKTFFFKHPDGRTTVVPFHRGKDIGRGLLRSILNDIKKTPDEFRKLP